MRLSSLFAAITIVVSSVSATVIPRDTTFTGSLTASNFYGAPIRPWLPESFPGWYYGRNPGGLKLKLPCLADEIICILLEFLPLPFHCPSGAHPSGYKPVFSNLTGAIEGDDYLTYGLVDTVPDCEKMCDTVENCDFINTYHDVNGKGGSPQLTCALFSGHHNATDAINFGGQTQPDGSIDYITDSAGYDKVKH